MPTTGVKIPSNLKKRIEDAVDEGDYTSNSDLIRMLSGGFWIEEMRDFPRKPSES